MIKKILFVFVNPPVEKQVFVPPLGILYLVSALRKGLPEWDGDIKILDMGYEKMYPSQVGKVMKDYQPDLVGFSAASAYSKPLHQLMKEARENVPHARIVVGGPHASNNPDDILKDSNSDIAVMGEGEITLVELVKSLSNGGSLENIFGIAYRDNGEIKNNGPRPFIEDLDTIAFPAWDLLDFDIYSELHTPLEINAAKPYSYMFSSRACPYKCAYCHSIFGKKFRARSAENVIEEMSILYNKYGVREIHFLDDVFNWDKKRAMEICDLIIAKGFKVKLAFPNGLRADIMDEELLDKMKEAGTYMISFAIETASQRVQKLVNRNLNLEKTRDIIATATKKKIISVGAFMLGFPTETPEEMEMTINFAKNSKLIKASFFTVVPYPGTRLYEIAREAYPEIDSSLDFAENLTYYSEKSYYSLSTGIDLTKIQRRAYRTFYFNLKRVWSIFWILPNKWTMVKGFYYGLYVISPIIPYIEGKLLNWRKRK